MRYLLRDALRFATEKHKGQVYDGGEFITHPILTAQLLGMVTTDHEVIAAGYLHDVLEDTDTTYEELDKIFGKRVAQLVLQVTKSGYNKFPRLHDQDAILILWASRFANLAHIRKWSVKKQRKYIKKSKFWEP